jgi:retron-type reverse transcriptase
VKAALLNTQYMPQAVRAVDIPKPSGGVWKLLQVLQPIFSYYLV